MAYKKNFKKKMTKEEYTAMQKERLASATDILKEGVHQIFESGRYEEYLRFMGGFHTYSVRNQILIMIQHPTATLVAGGGFWHKKHRYIKKDENHIDILAPIHCKRTKSYEDEVTGEEVEEEIHYTRYKAVPVFALDQTDGVPIPEICHTLDGGNEEELSALLTKLESIATCPITYEPISDTTNGFFSPQENRIVVKESLPTLHKVKTLCHEMTHAKLHGKGGSQENADCDTMEVQAESVAFCVLNYLGLDSSDYSFGYVAGWSKGKGEKALMENLKVIRDTADQIISALGLENTVENDVEEEEIA